VAQPWCKIEYAHNNWPHTVWDSYLSEWTHSTCAKFNPDISRIIREVLLMDKIKLFLLSVIHRVLNLSIYLVIHMPKQQLNIPWF
jgi:hypothetical protein